MTPPRCCADVRRTVKRRRYTHASGGGIPGDHIFATERASAVKQSEMTTKSILCKYQLFQMILLHCLIFASILMVGCKKNKITITTEIKSPTTQLDSAIVFYIGSKSIPFKLKLLRANENRQISFDQMDDRLTKTSNCTQCIFDANQMMAPKASLVIGLNGNVLKPLSALIKNNPDCGNTYIITYWSDTTWRRYTTSSSNIEILFDSLRISKLATIHGKSFFDLINKDSKSGNFGCM